MARQGTFLVPRVGVQVGFLESVYGDLERVPADSRAAQESENVLDKHVVTEAGSLYVPRVSVQVPQVGSPNSAYGDLRCVPADSRELL